MKALCLLIFCLSTLLLSAQANEGYMIFQSNGEVTLRQGDNVFSKPDGMQFLPGDILTINDGWVTLLDNQMKRVTLKENCTVFFETLTGLFKKTTASMENKYLVYLWEKMNEEEKHTTKKGGVVRGKHFPTFPYDSAVILSKSLCFKFYNPAKDPVKLMIKDHRQIVLHTIPTIDSVYCIDTILDKVNKSGIYYWSVRDVESESENRMFVIPSEVEKEQIDAEIKEIRNQLKDIPEPELTSVVRDIIKMKGWVY